MNEKSEDPAVAQSTKRDVSDGLQCTLDSQRRVGSGASEGMLANKMVASERRAKASSSVSI